MKNILVIGSINMDMVMETPHLPQIGETVSGLGFKTVQGGKGANQAIAAARLGGNVRMIGCVGDDIYGTTLKDSIESYGVDVSTVRTVPGASGVAAISVCNGNNCIIVYPGANAALTPEVLNENEDSFVWADIVVLQFEIPTQTVLRAAQMAKRHNAIVLVNPAPMQAFDRKLMDLVDIFVPNSIEAGQFLNQPEVEMSEAANAIEEIRKYGVELAIITMGKDGSVYNYGNEVLHQEAYEIQVVDTTAAGDSFIGGLCVALCDQKSIPDAISYATAVSTLTISREGASVSIPDAQEVDAFMKTLR